MLTPHIRKRIMEWALLVLLITAIHLLLAQPSWVERYYSTGMYPVLSRILSFVFGWIPFSLGDVLYFLAAVYFLYVIFRNARSLFKYGASFRVWVRNSFSVLKLFLVVYVVFYLMWGVNYGRTGIADRLALEEPAVYDSSAIIQLGEVLLRKVNDSKELLAQLKEPYPSKEDLFRRAHNLFKSASAQYPFLYLRKNRLSLKPTLFSSLGNYAGITGYYNPFTGEAQANTSIPNFLQPFIAAHEIAHQMGYAKEYEASFAGYLAITRTNDPLFKYSAYLDLFLYINREIYATDSTIARSQRERLHPLVRADIEEWRKFNEQYSGYFELLTSRFYSLFLRWNKQPEGMRSYGRVSGFLLAYYKKYGKID